jgi:hypothetical protein
MTERMTVNARVQVGAESTAGTAVSAGKLLECFNFKFGPKADVNMFTPTGRKYASEQEENMEWGEGSVDGNMDYNGLLYLLSSVFGKVTPSAFNSSATAKGWAFTPPVTGAADPQTYTFEQGDSVRAHKFAYGLLTKFGYKFSRKEASCSGDILAQSISDGITMTSSPTAVALAPIVGKHFNIYLDTTSGGIGGTQLTKVLSFEFSFDGIYGPFWPVNRSNASFAAHVDLPPKTMAKLLLEADSTGMSLLSNLQSGDTLFLRVEAQGAQIASDGGSGTDPIYNLFTHDMAVKVSSPNDFSDSDGIFATEWELTIVEDSGWAKAHTATVVSLVTAL